MTEITFIVNALRLFSVYRSISRIKQATNDAGNLPKHHSFSGSSGNCIIAQYRPRSRSGTAVVYPDNVRQLGFFTTSLTNLFSCRCMVRTGVAWLLPVPEKVDSVYWAHSQKIRSWDAELDFSVPLDLI